MSARRIVVIGAGVMGTTTAHALRAEGHEVCLLDAAPTAASASSHANGGFLSAAFCVPWAAPGLPSQAAAAMLDRQAPFRWRPDGRLAQLRWMRQLASRCNSEQFARARDRLVRLGLFSRACLHKVVADTGVRFDFLEAGVLLLLRQPPSAQVLDARLTQLQGLGFCARWLGADQVRALEPALSDSVQLAGAILVEDDACGDCERFVQGLLDWNVARGLTFEPDTRIDALDLDESGRLRAVRAGDRRWSADTFVFCTGVDTARLLRAHLSIPVEPVKGYSVTATLEPHQGPRRAIIDDSSKLAVSRLGDRVRLAGMAELVGYDPTVNRSRCAQLVSQYEALYDRLPDAGRSLWSGLRPMTPDGVPIVGATSIQGLYLNTGHGAYGWTLACGSAQLLADVLARRSTTFEPGLDPGAYCLDPRVRT